MSAFDPRRNSVGFLRVLFAALVIVSHAFPLGGFGTDPGRSSNNLGIFAVEGFFALSGFLITRSATRVTTGRYLWHRVVRIFPAYLVSLLAVAFIFGPIVWKFTHGLASYFQANPGPVGYVTNNFTLQLGQFYIGDSLASNPYPSLWNGPLYTLYYEFACYVLIAALAATRLLSGKVAAVLAIGCWISVQLWQFGDVWVIPDDRQAKFTLCFLVGSCLYFAQDRLLTKSIVLPLIAFAVFAASYGFGIGFTEVGLPAFAYLCIWVGAVLPFRGVGRRRDLSYGMYLYGWPVLQTLSFFGVNKVGYVPYLAITLVLTVGIAFLSWTLIESRALRLKNKPRPAFLQPRSVLASPRAEEPT